MSRLLRTVFAAVLLALPALSFASDDGAVKTLSQAAIIEHPSQVPHAGALVSGQPNAEVLEIIAAAGYVAVVDLRTIKEDRGIDEKQEVERLGMQYFSLPVPVPSGINSKNADKLAEIVQSVDGPVLLHCGSGNRVGALYALNARDTGASVEDALAIGRTAGLTKLADKVEIILREE